MGTYVYSLRKKHIEAKLDGIYPIDVMAFEYAYKESHTIPGDYGHAYMQRLSGRISMCAEKASAHYMQRAADEHGDGDQKFFIAIGGLTDGASVYQTINWMPTSHYDGTIESSNAELVGRLFKLGRGDWVVSEECPAHKWVEYTELADGTPIHQCERCDAIKDERFSIPSRAKEGISHANR
jgi:hypothetical protein